MRDSDLSFLSYTFDGEFIGEFTSAVTGYEQEYIEGPYRASWVFEQGDTLGESALRGWFNNRMMSQVIVKYRGEEVWAGFVWEMELELGNVVLKKDMTDVVNVAAIKYQPMVYNEETGKYEPDGDEIFVKIDANGDPISPDDDDTEGGIWVTHAESIKLYGWHEEILSSDGTAEEAIERAESTLQYMASPFNTSAVLKPVDKAQLRITAVGRMVAASKFYILDDRLRYIEGKENYAQGMGADPYTGETWTVSDEIRRIVEAIYENTGWLYVEYIADNDTPTRMGSTTQIGAFERILNLAKLRNKDEDFYSLIITHDGGVVYEKIDQSRPNMLWFPYPRGVEYADGTVPTWMARPGLIERVDEGVGPELPDTWLESRRYIYAERVRMAEGDSVASFHSRVFDIGDYYREYDANLKLLET